MNRQLLNLEPSITLALNQKAKEAQAQGRDVINFTAGEPDGQTPEAIAKAGIQAIEEGKTRYTPAHGIEPLIQAIVDKMNRTTPQTFEDQQVLVSNGGKQGIFNALYALLNPGDEVIVLTPAWVSYMSMVTMLGGKSVTVSSTIDQGFVPSLDQIKAAMTDKTRVILVNSPCNPTGAVFPQTFMDGLAQMLQDFPHVYGLTDDIYEHYTYQKDRPFYSLASSPHMNPDQLIVCNGVSKSHAMTGWRIGYTLAPKKVMQLMRKIQSQTTSNACSISQWAALKALQTETQTNPFVEGFAQRRDVIVENLSAIDHLQVIQPEGAFYVFPNVDHWLGPNQRFESDVALCEFLLEQANVAVVPGSAFGSPGHIRLSYGLPTQAIQTGVSRMAEALKQLDTR
jgi:aspartate aminotransferase